MSVDTYDKTLESPRQAIRPLRVLSPRLTPGRLCLCLCLLAALLVGAGCAPPPTEPSSDLDLPASVTCDEPRGDVCAQVYDPVCAMRDTGIRCVKAPCNAAERREYPSACAACQDRKVLSYVPGSCPADESQ
jgi:hypothetical protein